MLQWVHEAQRALGIREASGIVIEDEKETDGEKGEGQRTLRGGGVGGEVEGTENPSN